MGIAIYVLASLAVGLLCGWWVRGVRHSRGGSSGRGPTAPDIDDLMILKELSGELLVSQRNISAQLNNLSEKVEIFGRRVEALLKQSVNVDPGLSSSVSRQTEVRQIAPSWTDPKKKVESLGVPRTSEQEMGQNPLLEEAAREFLVAVDSREFDNAAVARFFGDRNTGVSIVLEFENRWTMIAVHSLTKDGIALGIPAIRVGMRQIDLQSYFDFINHNGLDPIRGTQVIQFASLSLRSSEWTTILKGVIDGSR